MKIITRSHAIPKSYNTRYIRVSEAFSTNTRTSRNFREKGHYSYTSNEYDAMSNCWRTNYWCSDNGFPYSQTS
ncbi:MAG: hypothetical protein HOG49_28440 [Candidatus Scalindua sp.]|nr:hypothetical protein [Candidatus Scalindua sp.]